MISPYTRAVKMTQPEGALGWYMKQIQVDGGHMEDKIEDREDSQHLTLLVLCDRVLKEWRECRSNGSEVHRSNRKGRGIAMCLP
jgi:hypothetical protein